MERVSHSFFAFPGEIAVMTHSNDLLRKVNMKTSLLDCTTFTTHQWLFSRK